MHEVLSKGFERGQKPRHESGDSKAPVKFNFEATLALAREMMRSKTLALREKVEQAKKDGQVAPETLTKWEDELMIWEDRYGMPSQDKPTEYRH